MTPKLWYELMDKLHLFEHRALQIDETNWVLRGELLHHIGMIKTALRQSEVELPYDPNKTAN